MSARHHLRLIYQHDVDLRTRENDFCLLARAGPVVFAAASTVASGNRRGEARSEVSL